MDGGKVHHARRHGLHRPQRGHLPCAPYPLSTQEPANTSPANFINFLKEANVPLDPTPLTFAVSRDDGLFEWASASPASLFCQPANFLSPRFWRMLFDIVRFNHFAVDLLAGDDGDRGSVGEYLEREGYSAAFRDDYLIPMTAAVWGTGPGRCALDFPVVTLVRVLWNHHLLSILAARPKWLTLRHCAQSYIDAIMEDFPDDHVFLRTSVWSLMNEPSGKVRLLLGSGTTALYDEVILATHGDQALSIVHATATPQEAAILSAFTTSRNRAVLHSDTSLLPRSPIARSSWNYITRWGAQPNNVDAVCLTYDLNTLQHIPRTPFGDVLVTLNPLRPPRPETVRAEFEYAHLVYTREAARAQGLLSEIQGTRGIRYAGAWTGYGFHEDGFTSGLRAAEALGGRVGFVVRDSTFGRGKPDFGVKERVIRMAVSVVQFVVVGAFEWVFGSGREVEEKKHA